MSEEFFLDDDAVIQEAMDTMESMCGNAGQEAIIEEGSDAFEEWASEALDTYEIGGFYETMVAVLGDEKFFGTSDIWNEGWNIVSEAAGWQEAADYVLDLFDWWIEGGQGDVFDAISLWG